MDIVIKFKHDTGDAKDRVKLTQNDLLKLGYDQHFWKPLSCGQYGCAMMLKRKGSIVIVKFGVKHFRYNGFYVPLSWDGVKRYSEYENAVMAHNLGVGPATRMNPVVGSNMFQPKTPGAEPLWVMEMDFAGSPLLSVPLRDRPITQLIDLAARCYNAGLIHGDLNSCAGAVDIPGNIMYNKDQKKYTLIDFAFASYAGHNGLTLPKAQPVVLEEWEKLRKIDIPTPGEHSYNHKLLGSVAPTAAEWRRLIADRAKALQATQPATPPLLQPVAAVATPPVYPPVTYPSAALAAPIYVPAHVPAEVKESIEIPSTLFPPQAEQKVVATNAGPVLVNVAPKQKIGKKVYAATNGVPVLPTNQPILPGPVVQKKFVELKHKAFPPMENGKFIIVHHKDPVLKDNYRAQFYSMAEIDAMRDGKAAIPGTIRVNTLPQGVQDYLAAKVPKQQNDDDDGEPLEEAVPVPVPAPVAPAPVPVPVVPVAAVAAAPVAEPPAPVVFAEPPPPPVPEAVPEAEPMAVDISKERKKVTFAENLVQVRTISPAGSANKIGANKRRRGDDDNFAALQRAAEAEVVRIDAEKKAEEARKVAMAKRAEAMEAHALVLELDEQTRKLREEADNLEKLREKARKDREEIAAALRDLQAHSEADVQELEEVKLARAKLATANEEATKQLQGEQITGEQIAAQLAQFRSVYEKTSTETAALQAAIDKKAVELEALNAEATRLEGQIREGKDWLEKAQREKAALGDIDREKRRLDELTLQRDNLNAAVTSTSADVKRLESDLEKWNAELMKFVAKQEAMRNAYNARLAKIQDELETAAAEQESKNAEMEQAEEQLELLNDGLKHLRAQSEETSASAAELQEAIAKKENDLQKLKSDYEEKNKQTDELIANTLVLEERAAAVYDQYNAEVAYLEKADKHIAIYERKRAARRARIEALQRLLETQNRVIADAKARVEDAYAAREVELRRAEEVVAQTNKVVFAKTAEAVEAQKKADDAAKVAAMANAEAEAMLASAENSINQAQAATNRTNVVFAPPEPTIVGVAAPPPPVVVAAAPAPVFDAELKEARATIEAADVALADTITAQESLEQASDDEYDALRDALEDAVDRENAAMTALRLAVNGFAAKKGSTKRPLPALPSVRNLSVPKRQIYIERAARMIDLTDDATSSADGTVRVTRGGSGRDWNDGASINIVITNNSPSTDSKPVAAVAKDEARTPAAAARRAPVERMPPNLTLSEKIEYVSDKAEDEKNAADAKRQKMLADLADEEKAEKEKSAYDKRRDKKIAALKKKAADEAVRAANNAKKAVAVMEQKAVDVAERIDPVEIAEHKKRVAEAEAAKPRIDKMAEWLVGGAPPPPKPVVATARLKMAMNDTLLRMENAAKEVERNARLMK